MRGVYIRDTTVLFQQRNIQLLVQRVSYQCARSEYAIAARDLFEDLPFNDGTALLGRKD